MRRRVRRKKGKMTSTRTLPRRRTTMMMMTLTKKPNRHVVDGALVCPTSASRYKTRLHHVPRALDEPEVLASFFRFFLFGLDLHVL